MYNGMTGQKMKIMIFIGPTFYMRLKHLVEDKIHCLTLDHQVLTEDGWKFFNQLSKEDMIATLNENKLEYQHPTNLIHYPSYKGKLFRPKSDIIDQVVTSEHKMYVSNDGTTFKRSKVSDFLTDQSHIYKKDCIVYGRNIDVDLSDIIHDGELDKWVLKLNSEQSLIALNSILKEESVYYTHSETLSDDLMILALHAGVAINKSKSEFNDVWKLEVIKNVPTVNDYEVIDFCGPVFCLQVPNEIFFVRRNGQGSWTGNSRARGPRTILTRQPPEGRSREGGLRLGEMERDSILAHGMAKFLKEKLLDTSDAYSTYVCNICGLFAQRLYRKDSKHYITSNDIFFCSACKNYTQISKVMIPYAFKLLVQELLSLNIAPRIRVNQDMYI